MKYKYEIKNNIPAREEVGHFKAKPRYLKAILILAFILFIAGMTLRSVIYAPVASADTPDAPVTIKCQFIEGGYACDDPSKIISAMDEYADICGLDSVVCEHERLHTFEAIQTRYSRADSCHNKRGNECLTAIGRDTKQNHTVACPRSLKLGTRIMIEGKEYVCEDRYATWLDGKRGLPTVDVFAEADMLSTLPAYKRVTVEVLK